MSASPRRWQRRALVLLAWLIWGLAAVPVASVMSERSPVALVCGAVGAAGAAVAAGQPQRREVARAIPLDESPGSGLMPRTRARPQRRPPGVAPARDGRHAYLTNLSILC